MNTENQILRLNIDGSWTASEMSECIREIEFLYGLRLYLNTIEDDEINYRELFDFFPIRYWRRWIEGRGIHPMFMSPAKFLFNSEELQQFTRIYFPQQELKIRRIKYGSEGNKDYLGIGEVLKQIRLFIQYLIDLRGNLKQKDSQNTALQIENARNFTKLRLETARADAEIAGYDNGLPGLVEQKIPTIRRLIDERKITDTKMLENDKPENKEQNNQL